MVLGHHWEVKCWCVSLEGRILPEIQILQCEALLEQLACINEDGGEMLVTRADGCLLISFDAQHPIVVETDDTKLQGAVDQFFSTRRTLLLIPTLPSSNFAETSALDLIDVLRQIAGRGLCSGVNFKWNVLACEVEPWLLGDSGVPLGETSTDQLLISIVKAKKVKRFIAKVMNSATGDLLLEVRSSDGSTHLNLMKDDLWIRGLAQYLAETNIPSNRLQISS